jgi:hypothetical protein
LVSQARQVPVEVLTAMGFWVVSLCARAGVYLLSYTIARRHNPEDRSS